MINKAQMMIEEQKLNNSTETAILPMQCYVQPFFRLLHKDCFLAIREIESNSIDLIVTDPPYGINLSKGYKIIPHFWKKVRKNALYQPETKREGVLHRQRARRARFGGAGQTFGPYTL